MLSKREMQIPFSMKGASLPPWLPVVVRQRRCAGKHRSRPPLRGAEALRSRPGLLTPPLTPPPPPRSRRAADKGKQVPQELHFQNEVDGGRSLKNVYKKMGLNKLADKIRHFKIKP